MRPRTPESTAVLQDPPIVEITVRGDVARREVDKLRAELAALERRVKGPILGIRAVLTQERNPSLERPARAQAEVNLAGRPVYARVAAPAMAAAVDDLAERMERHLHRHLERIRTDYRGPSQPEPGEWFHGARPAARPEPRPRRADARRLVRRKSFALGTIDPAQALAEMEALDHGFHVFYDAITDADAVGYTREDGRFAVIVPRDTRVPDYPGPVWEESRFSGPIEEETAAREMGLLGHRFLYFVNAANGRGNVIYLRYDGDYGLIEPHAGGEDRAEL